jgi:hypothetical protein
MLMDALACSSLFFTTDTLERIDSLRFNLGPIWNVMLV